MAMKKFSDVDAYIAFHERWSAGLQSLRGVLRSAELEESLKWGAPWYTHDGKNVVGLASFKDYFGLWFHQGALLKDARGVLINAQDGKTKALRQWRFGDPKQVKTKIVRAYVREAMELARSGREVARTRNARLVVPAELAGALKKRPKTKVAFAGLTPARRREYAEYVTEAKRDATKASRVKKIVPMIDAGIGLHDKYRGG